MWSKCFKAHIYIYITLLLYRKHILTHSCLKKTICEDKLFFFAYPTWFSAIFILLSDKGCCTANTPTEQLPSGHFGTVSDTEIFTQLCLSVSPYPYGCQSGLWPVRQAVGCDGQPRLLPQPPPLLYPPHPTWPGTHHWPSGDSCQMPPFTNPPPKMSWTTVASYSLLLNNWDLLILPLIYLPVAWI